MTLYTIVGELGYEGNHFVHLIVDKLNSLLEMTTTVLIYLDGIINNVKIQK